MLRHVEIKEMILPRALKFPLRVRLCASCRCSTALPVVFFVHLLQHVGSIQQHSAPDDVPVGDNAARTRSVSQKRADSPPWVSVSKIRAHILKHTFPPTTTTTTHPVLFGHRSLRPSSVSSSLVPSKGALVN